MTLALVLAILAILAILTLLFGLALMSAAKGADQMDSESGVLATLAGVRSPTGRPFFPTGDSVQDFMKTLEDSREELRLSR